MTEPYDLDKEEVLFERPRTDAWIERVRAADAGAEELWRYVRDLPKETSHEEAIAATLLVIAAELRAVRIARRPGAGQS